MIRTAPGLKIERRRQTAAPVEAVAAQPDSRTTAQEFVPVPIPGLADGRPPGGQFEAGSEQRSGQFGDQPNAGNPRSGSVLRRKLFITTRPGHQLEITKDSRAYRDVLAAARADPYGEAGTQQRRWARLIDDLKADHIFKSESDIVSYARDGHPQPKTVIRQSPDLSPVHAPAPSDAAATKYRLNTGPRPANYQFPQSPTHSGDPRPHIEDPMDFAPTHAAMKDFHQQPRNMLHARNTLNTFTYDIGALVRLTRVELQPSAAPSSAAVSSAAVSSAAPSSAAPAEPTAWGLDPTSIQQRVSARSEVYQSHSTEVPASRNALGIRRIPDAAATLELVRTGVKLAYDTAKQYNQFADTSVLAFDRPANKVNPKDKKKGTVDYSKVADHVGGVGTAPYVIENRSLGCAMFHSETQALGLATAELPATMRTLVDQIVAACRAVAPVQAVIVALTVRGVSHPNAVCGGACKPALVTLLDRINQQLVTEYHPRKPALRAEKIWLRRSENYRATMDVQGLQAFQGSERGAVQEAAPVIPGHGQVTEYKA